MRIFLSYSRTDSADAEWLSQQLRSRGFEVWIDHKGIRAGSTWHRAIEEAVETCDAMVVLCSKASVESAYVDSEWQHAVDIKKRIVPVLLEPCNVPRVLTTRQLARRQSDRKLPVDEIVAALREQPVAGARTSARPFDTGTHTAPRPSYLTGRRPLAMLSVFGALGTMVLATIGYAAYSKRSTDCVEGDASPCFCGAQSGIKECSAGMFGACQCATPEPLSGVAPPAAEKHPGVAKARAVPARSKAPIEVKQPPEAPATPSSPAAGTAREEPKQEVETESEPLAEPARTPSPSSTIDEASESATSNVATIEQPPWPKPKQAVWYEDFETPTASWSIEGGVWAMGVPTAADGPKPHGGRNVVGTVLSGNYPNGASARLVSPLIDVPKASENPRLRYWYWHAFASDYGEVQIRVAGASGWVDAGEHIAGSDEIWKQRIIDLRKYERKKIQVSFRLAAYNDGNTAPGWYLDDVSFETGPMRKLATTDFEQGFGDWSIEGGVWSIGKPIVSGGPKPRSGKNVAGTGLDRHYPSGIDARLVSPQFTVPAASKNPRFRYAYWYEFAGDYGELQIRIEDGGWRDLSETLRGEGRQWNLHIVDLRPYERQTIQIGFRLASYNDGTTAPGWYIDDAAFETASIAAPAPQDFERGFNDWSIDGGVWAIGAPTLSDGPKPHGGKKVAGTVLDGNYPSGADARLVTPEFVVPAASTSPMLRYWYWYDFAGDYGEIQVRPAGGGWRDLGQPALRGTGEGWLPASIDLSRYAGQTVRIGFRLASYNDNTTAPGWYIDDVVFPKP